MQLKTFPKRVIQKTAESTGDLIGTKIDNKFPGFQKIYNRIIHKQLQMIIIKEYLKKDMYFKKKRIAY